MPTIDNLPVAGALSGSEPIPCTQGSSEAKQTTAQDIANLAPPVPALPLSIADGGSGQTTAQAALDAFFASVTKGMLWTGDGTHVTGVAVGADGKVLTADSGAGNGVSWQTPAAAPVTSVNSLVGALTVAGTVNQITVTSGGTTMTLSLPSSIDLGSSGAIISGGTPSGVVTWGVTGQVNVTAPTGEACILAGDHGGSVINLATGNVVNILGSGGIFIRGPWRSNQTAGASTPGTVIAKIAINDNTGTLIGYLPIYDVIT